MAASARATGRNRAGHAGAAARLTARAPQRPRRAAARGFNGSRCVGEQSVGADVQALVDAHRRFVGATNTLMRIHTQRLSAGGVV